MDKDLIFKDDNIKTVLSELLDYDINKYSIVRLIMERVEYW